jgi:hypothetical protein
MEFKHTNENELIFYLKQSLSRNNDNAGLYLVYILKCTYTIMHKVEGKDSAYNVL